MAIASSKAATFRRVIGWTHCEIRGRKGQRKPEERGGVFTEGNEGNGENFSGQDKPEKALRKAGREEGMSKGRGVNHRDAENCFWGHFSSSDGVIFSFPLRCVMNSEIEGDRKLASSRLRRARTEPKVSKKYQRNPTRV
jgi:hypothetical protein